MIPDFSVRGKVVAITGAAGILCGEMARELGELGAKVAVCDIDVQKGEGVAADIRSKGGEAAFFRTDVLDRAALEKTCSDVVECFGRVDGLINGAGGNRKDATTSPELSFFDLPAAALRGVFELNFIGTFLTSQVFAAQMAKQGAGSIVNISSMTSLTPLTNVVGYGAAKAAVNNFTQWLAVYLNQNCSKKLRVNAIAPGFLLTEQNRYLLTNPDGSPTERSAKILAGTPMARYGEPQELTGAVVWLLSEAASFVTGVVVPIDGGYASYSGV